MIAPGVSSTISSTPVACSSARMLRPSRPMIRPFMSSLGRSTTDTVVSMAVSAALRWMASVMMCWARAAAVSRASASRRLTRLAASRRASASICFRSSSRASSAVSPATRCSSRWRSARICSLLIAAASSALLGVGDRAVARAQVALEGVGRQRAVGERAGLLGERLFQAGDLHLARPRRALGVGDHAVRLLAGFELGFFLEGLGVARRLLAEDAGLFFGAADGLGRDPLAAGDPPDDGRQRDDVADDGNDAEEVHGGRGHRVPFIYATAARRRRAANGEFGRRVVGEEKRPRFAVWGGRLNLG